MVIVIKTMRTKINVFCYRILRENTHFQIFNKNKFATVLIPKNANGNNNIKKT